MLERISCVRLVSPASGVKSERLLFQSHSSVRLVSPANGVRSAMEFLPRDSRVRLVSPASGVKSETPVLVSVSHVRLASPASGVRSDISLLFTYLPSTLSMPRCNRVRLVANSSPVKSRMPELGASRRVKVAISSAVIGALLALPSALAIAACSLASGMATPPFPALPVLTTGESRLQATRARAPHRLRTADLFNHLDMIQSFRRSVSTCPSLGGPVLEFYPSGISHYLEGTEFPLEAGPSRRCLGRWLKGAS